MALATSCSFSSREAPALVRFLKQACISFFFFSFFFPITICVVEWIQKCIENEGEKIFFMKSEPWTSSPVPSDLKYRGSCPLLYYCGYVCILLALGGVGGTAPDTAAIWKSSLLRQLEVTSDQSKNMFSSFSCLLVAVPFLNVR